MDAAGERTHQAGKGTQAGQGSFGGHPCSLQLSLHAALPLLLSPTCRLSFPACLPVVPISPLTCWTCSSTTRSLASSGDSTSKQSSRSVGETVSSELDGRNMRWKRFLITCQESSGVGPCEGYPKLPLLRKPDLSPTVSCRDSSTTGMLCSAHHLTRGGWTSLALLQWPSPPEQGSAQQHPVHDTAARRQNPSHGHVGYGQGTVSDHIPCRAVGARAPTRAAHGLLPSLSTLTSARRRFSGFTRTLWATESSTSMALEFSLLILTRNCHQESATSVTAHQGMWPLT